MENRPAQNAPSSGGTTIPPQPQQYYQPQQNYSGYQPQPEKESTFNKMKRKMKKFWTKTKSKLHIGNEGSH